MTLSRISILLLSLIMSLSALAGVYTSEADSFLMKMPQNLQTVQAEAIKKAIGGDNTDLISIRESRNVPYPLPASVKATDVAPGLRLFSGQSVERQEDTPLLVYFHGGGWTFGSMNSCSAYCVAMAENGVSVLAVDYRLAPEHPFPEGLNDCVAAVKMALDSIGAWKCGSVSVGGDSSGGNLALATAMSMPEGALRSMVLFYPVTRAYEDNSESWAQYGCGYGLDSDLMGVFNNAYTADVHNALVSPAEAPDSVLAKLPPTMIVSAERDILCDQGRELAGRLGDIGVDVSYNLFPGAVHLFITVAGQCKAFNEAVKLSSDFIKRR